MLASGFKGGFYQVRHCVRHAFSTNLGDDFIIAQTAPQAVRAKQQFVTLLQNHRANYVKNRFGGGAEAGEQNIAVDSLQLDDARVLLFKVGMITRAR